MSYLKNIEILCQRFRNCCLYLAGDFNARTKDFLDFIPNDNLNYVFDVETGYKSDYFDISRNDKDNEKSNSFGRSLVDLCCTHDIHILNGRLFNDYLGNYTCITNNGKSVVDYHIASSEIFQCLTFFNVVDCDESDHFPIHSRLSLGVKKFTGETSAQTESIGLFPLERFRWKSNHSDIFIQSFHDKILSLSDDVTNLINVDFKCSNSNNHFY